MKTLRLSIALFSLFASACDLGSTEPSAEGASDRGPLGKADAAGSCQGPDTDFCGEQSDGACWCDELCVEFGDCCSDRVAVCEGEEPEFCAAGHVETEDTFTDSSDEMSCVVPVQHCVTDDHGACPQLSPLPPDFCPDGEVVPGAPHWITSADGMECRMPSVHCVTNDERECPQFSPRPPDWCAEGTVVADAPSFIPSGDGMECLLPSIHCVTNDADACTPEPEFCAEGTIVAETQFVDGEEFDCTEEELHCVTNDFGACPQLSPLPPDFCEHGDVVAGTPSFISSADGMQCQMPSVHCVTRDSGACPQFSPPSPNFCADGQIMQGEPSFISSSDGMECRIPSIHCVAAEQAACSEE